MAMVLGLMGCGKGEGDMLNEIIGGPIYTHVRAYISEGYNERFDSMGFSIEDFELENANDFSSHYYGNWLQPETWQNRHFFISLKQVGKAFADQTIGHLKKLEFIKDAIYFTSIVPGNLLVWSRESELQARQEYFDQYIMSIDCNVGFGSITIEKNFSENFSPIPGQKSFGDYGEFVVVKFCNALDVPGETISIILWNKNYEFIDANRIFGWKDGQLYELKYLIDNKLLTDFALHNLAVLNNPSILESLI